MSRLNWGLVIPGEAIQELGSILIKPTEALCLNVPGNEPGDEVFGKSGWRRRSEHRAPQGAKLVEAERPYASDLGLQLLFAFRLHTKIS